MPRSHADYVRAGKLGWARGQTKAARRSLAGVKSWRGRRSATTQKRAEAAARRKVRSRAEDEKQYERPEARTPEEIHGLIWDAAWSALIGDVETALELAEEAVAGQPKGYMFAIRAQFLFADGEDQWISLTALTPLESLGVALLAMLEKSRMMLKRGHTPGAETEKDGEVREEPTELVDVDVYLSRGDWTWR